MYKVFFIEPTDDVFCYLRRYRAFEKSSQKDECFHEAMIFLERRENKSRNVTISDSHPHDDIRWPVSCSKCDYKFKEDDTWQLFKRRVYKDTVSGKEYTLEDAPVGACYEAWWTGRKGPDGRALVLKTPGGDWYIDSRANNCTMPDDSEHRCWCREGKPEFPETFSVNKKGYTCSAGAGSILMGQYHGFLTNGFLIPA